MKILITGGAGFIGSNFIRYILGKYSDYQIANLDALTYAGNLENLRDLEEKPNYSFVRGDITDSKLVNKLVKMNDAVINFAAETHVDRSIMGSTAFVQTNIIGTQALLEAAKNNGLKRFHQVSTDEVYGSLAKNDLPFCETTPYNPRSPYSASKAGADHLVRSYFHTYNLPITISNCSNNYGPFQFPEKLHALFITNLLEDKKVPIYGDGQQVRDWLHVSDHCRALDVILHQGKIGETYCVGGDCEKTNLEITHKILSLLDKDESWIEHVNDRPGHDRRYAIDFSKIKRELGWQPQVSFDEGMKSTVRWYQDNIGWWSNVKNGQYLEYYKKQYHSA